MIRFIMYSAFFFVLSVGMVGTSEGRVPAGAKPVTVNLMNADGRTVRTAVLSEAEPGVKITFDIKNLPPGAHLVHIHQFPKCEAPDFKSAGPHFDPAGAGHSEHGSAGLPAAPTRPQ